ncbi:hypothetical protein [Shimia sp. SDUM112013]|uniref:2Fe-2S iron-sulfur cluster-binding protein n=1 Tax=Shimia sp. SDUM112013 TaxID=3136160 RepID=UPI0032EC2677
MIAARDALAGIRFDIDNYHQENCVALIETMADRPALDVVFPDDDSAAAILFSASSVTTKVSETYKVLAAARSVGMNIPSDFTFCTFGVFDICKVRKTQGEVHMVHNDGISDDDIEAGNTLVCCSSPNGKVAVEE